MLECGGLIPFRNLFSPSTVSSRDKGQLSDLHGKCFHLLAYLFSSIVLLLLLILIILFFGLCIATILKYSCPLYIDPAVFNCVKVV